MKHIVFLMLLAGPVMGSVCENRGSVGPNIRFIDYMPNKPYKIQAAVNQSTIFSFDTHERVTWVDCGNCGPPQSTNADSDIIPRWTWRLSKNEERLFIRPQAPGIRTNISIETSRGRFYTFKVISSKHTTLNNPHNVWRAHFCYPEQERKAKAMRLAAEREAASKRRKAEQARDIRFIERAHTARRTAKHYDWDRTHILAPLQVWDDGKFTHFVFHENKPTVGIYTVDVDGFDVSTNERVEGNTIVVDGVAAQYTLRRSGKALCVLNNRTKPTKMAQNHRGPHERLNFSAD